MPRPLDPGRLDDEGVQPAPALEAILEVGPIVSPAAAVLRYVSGHSLRTSASRARVPYSEPLPVASLEKWQAAWWEEARRLIPLVYEDECHDTAGGILGAMRRRMAMPRKEFANACHVAPETLNRIEEHLELLTWKQINVLARVTGIPEPWWHWLNRKANTQEAHS